MEWKIQSRAHACQGCGRAFSHGEVLHTVLFDERDAYRRQDLCETCWQGEAGQGSDHRRGFVSHWQSAYEPPPMAPPEPIQKETAETLLRKLLGLGDPRHAPALFILAVMLERKRLLRAKAQAVDAGQRLLIYEHVGSGDVLTIPDPNLQLDQLEVVQRDVAHLLERGLPDAPEAASSSAAPPPSETGAPAAGASAGLSGPGAETGGPSPTTAPPIPPLPEADRS